MSPLELFGYFGSVLVAISLMMKNIVKLRWINFAGAAVFSAYGLMVKAYPVFALNGFIAIVDLYYLYQMKKETESFSIWKVDFNNELLNRFLKFYNDDILKFFHGFKQETLKDAEIYFILRNLLPVGLFAYKKCDNNIAEILIDYAIASHRDFKNSHFLFHSGINEILDQKIGKFVTETNNKIHIDYLKKIGFKEENKKFVLNI